VALPLLLSQVLLMRVLVRNARGPFNDPSVLHPLMLLLSLFLLLLLLLLILWL
jgi:hypothetical protein